MFTIPYVTCVTCHMSRVTCHVSRVTCHMSHVTCHKKNIYIYIKKNGKSGGASRLRVCYQRGLPRLVLCMSAYMSLEYIYAEKNIVGFFLKGKNRALEKGQIPPRKLEQGPRTTGHTF